MPPPETAMLSPLSASSVDPSAPAGLHGHIAADSRKRSHKRSHKRIHKRSPRALPNWLREPLLHFVVLGSLLFAIDQIIVSRTDDPRAIVISAEVDEEARALFLASRSREPNPDEVRALRERWLDNEVLYREGLALQVDKGDTAIRERVIFKSLSVVEASLKLPALDEKVLRQWFDGPARQIRRAGALRFSGSGDGRRQH